jgi:5-methylcytosine-specific restriction endonuclease McrA
MKTYTKTYLQYFNYDVSDFIPCEICGSKAVDIHHIHSRKMGGTKGKDVIENLMALCRGCHLEYGDIADKRDWLQEIHNSKL